MMRRLPIATGLLLTLPSFVSGAMPPPGEYRLSTGSTVPTIRNWGPHCPPKPQKSQSRSGARYQLTDNGTLEPHNRRSPPLIARGVCRLATGLPNLSEGRPSKTKIRCNSASNAAKRVSGRVELDVSDPNRIVVTHLFEYAWQLAGSKCEMTLAGRWTLDRVDPLSKATVQAAPADPCATPGPATRIEIVGASRRIVQPNGRARLKYRLRDAKNCPVSGDVEWSTSAGEIDKGGIFRPVDLAVDEQVTVVARLGSTKATWRLSVAKDSQDFGALVEALPELGDEPSLGRASSAPASSPPAAATTVTKVADHADEGSGALLYIFGALGLIALGICGYIGWRTIFLRRRSPLLDPAALDELSQTSRPGASDASTGGSVGRAGNPGSDALQASGGGLASEIGRISTPSSGVGTLVSDDGIRASTFPERDSTEPNVCPHCDRRFDAGTRFCPHDGEVLETPAGAPTPNPEASRHRTCPTCGDRLPPNLIHCPNDGARLVDERAETGAVGREIGDLDPSASSSRCICPTCGTQHPADVEFCVHDGTRLVLLN